MFVDPIELLNMPTSPLSRIRKCIVFRSIIGDTLHNTNNTSFISFGISVHEFHSYLSKPKTGCRFSILSNIKFDIIYRIYFYHGEKYLHMVLLLDNITLPIQHIFFISHVNKILYVQLAIWSQQEHLILFIQFLVRLI